VKSGYLLVGTLVVVAGVVQSCATNGPIEATTASDGGGPLFTRPSDDGGSDAAADVSVAPDVAMCVATTCTPPLATCDDGAIARCNVDLLSDNDNCGECGHKCENYDPLMLGSRCAGGKCKAFCTSPQFLDCNGIVDDGCEANVMLDPKNCGACGHACAAGEPCNSGVCGCPSGQVVCNGACVDLQSDDKNCGTCGAVCQTLRGPCAGGSLPTNTIYGCKGGTCEHFKCDLPDVHKDCNGDLNLGCNSDGCEVDVNSDLNNCGLCGNKCAAPATFCGGGVCLCGPGETPCVDPVNGKGCAVLDNDPNNCGACNNRCPTVDGVITVCRNGTCGLECPAPMANCNGDWADGCEINLFTDMRHCGACGSSCDADAGQPCINGVCLTGPCGPIPTH
jgi:hypothetical protein